MQIASMSLTNGSAEAVQLDPKHKNGFLVTYADLTQAKASDAIQVSLGMRPAKANVSRKVTVKVAVPYTVTEDDSTSTKTVTGFIDIVVPEDADTSIVADLLALMSGACLDPQVKDVAQKGAFPY